MKTAEVAIEHVLVGLLVLCAFLLPFSMALIDSPWFQKEVLLGVLGVAYLVGVVCDKVADTILSFAEQVLRLEYADKNLKKQPEHTGDPFPQDVLENNIRRAGDGRLEWMDNLRTRIRVCRGLAVWGLPAVLGIVIFLAFSTERHVKYDLIILPIAINIVLVILSLWIVSSNKIDRTDAVKAGNNTALLSHARKQCRSNRSLYAWMLINSGIFSVLIIPYSADQSQLALIGICGTAIVLLAFWAWRRITKTYMSFLSQQMFEITGG